MRFMESKEERMFKFKPVAKSTMQILGINSKQVYERIGTWSLFWSMSQNGLHDLAEKLRAIIPDISNQDSCCKEIFNAYVEVKWRACHAFQCSLMLKCMEKINADRVTVVDIGDSAGTHMLYLKELTKNRFLVDTISVNLDERAIEKISARGLKALLCRLRSWILVNSISI